MQVLTHEVAAIRKQGALGVGEGALCKMAGTCDEAGAHIDAALLVFAAGAVRGNAAGAEMRRAWESLQRLEEAGGGSSQSRALESRVLSGLLLATEGGFDFGSAGHAAVLARMAALGTRQSV